MRYTLRNVPESLDHALRERARLQSKSLNEVILEALHQALRVDEPRVQRDLSDIIGTWQSDPEIDRALADQRQVDTKAW